MDIRAMQHDEGLNIEISRFTGIVQNFPIHFHDYYTVGFIKSGEMNLGCKNAEYIVKEKSLVLLAPNDSHFCSDKKGELLDFRSLNISVDIMRNAVFDVTGEDTLPHFIEPVRFSPSLFSYVEEIHNLISLEEKGFEKEELFLLIIEELVQDHCSLKPMIFKTNSIDLNEVLKYINLNYYKNITLNNLCTLIGLSKYHFLRLFTKKIGITPYKYLETIRINNAKDLLKQGVSPVDTALQTGFTDQSHLNKSFKKIIGITPKQYGKMF